MSTETKPGPVATEVLRRVVVTRFDIEDIVLVPVLAVVIALILGGIIMLATGIDLPTIGEAFGALFTGSVGSLGAISETLTAAAPLTLAGLGIALGFRAGPLQHRGGGPAGPRRRRGGRGRLLLLRPPRLHPPAAGASRRHGGGRALGSRSPAG